MFTREITLPQTLYNKHMYVNYHKLLMGKEIKILIVYRLILVSYKLNLMTVRISSTISTKLQSNILLKTEKKIL